MLSIQPKSQTTPAAGIAEQTIVTAIAASKTGIVVRISYTNLDTVAHTAILKKGGVEIKRVAGIPAGACEEEWCSGLRPIILTTGESLVGDQGEATTTTEPSWVVDFYEGTD